MKVHYGGWIFPLGTDLKPTKKKHQNSFLKKDEDQHENILRVKGCYRR